ncbi:hypothetical protein BCV72DRAFT_329352 [Rhizopus microsporus var. microsporus]|uniref:Uncharacterized protein n=1 Tax=Rhizopus microsporus var. microsporus TaxID=86635 RepID=A0A1X0R2H1_RHIZD|nr:hypothetical protein BCV72DRAFT_329352 [Rhizopus microsporus var. microsporus]
MISMAVDLAGLERSVMTDYMDKNGEKRNHLLWVDLVKENFEITAENLKERNLAFPPEASSSKKESTATPEEYEYRTCSISLKRIRKDLSINITDIIDNKMKESTIKLSDYFCRFFSIIQMMALRIKTIYLSQEMAKWCYKRRKAQTKKPEKHPVESAMFKKLNITKGSYHQKELHNEEMSIALAFIVTNIKNIWSDDIIFKKLLDNLLNVLLKLRLAENKAAEYSEYIKNIKEKSKSTTVVTSSVSSTLSTIDHKRHVLRSEYKKINTLERKLENLDDEDKMQRYVRRITRGHDRITYIKGLPKKTVSSDARDVAANEASKKYKNDASRSRLSCLKSAANHLFSSCTDVTRNDIQRELQILTLIAQTLQPYIPDKQNHFVVAR